MVWIFVTLLAASLQTMRFMVQKKLRMDTLSSGGATYARFVYAGPLIVAVALGYLSWTQAPMPHLTARFWILASLGGVTQILATMCLVSLFQLRNFTVGITFAKTEVLLTVLSGMIVLGETVTALAGLAIGVGVIGAILLSDIPMSQGHFGKRMLNRGTALGLGAGLLFSICSVAYRGATMEIASDAVLVRSLTTLMVVIFIQALLMTVFLRLREPGQITAVLQSWRTAIWVGALSLGGSIGWFTAFAMQNAAYVKAVGQIEIVFSIAITTLVFGETISRREIWGVGFLLISVVALILVA